MSDFLLVVPPGWVEIPNCDQWLGQAIDRDGLDHIINNQLWYDIDNFLGPLGYLPEGMTANNGRLIRTETGFRFWTQFIAAT